MNKLRSVIGLTLFLLSCSALSASSAQVLLPVKHGDKWGYINKSGQIVIKAVYDAAGMFAEGLAPVGKGKNDAMKYGYINTSGKMIIKPQFNSTSGFREGMASVTMKEQIGFIDKTGKLVIKPQFSFADDFHEGLTPVCTGTPRTAKYGYINKTGKMVVSKKFDSAGNFSQGLAPVAVGDKWGYIDKTGKMIIDMQFDEANSFSEGLAVVSTGRVYYKSEKTGKVDESIIMQEGKCGYIDKTGKIVIEPRFGYAQPFSDGLAAVMTGEMKPGRKWTWGYIDKAGKFVIEPKFPFAESFSEGVAAVCVGDFSIPSKDINDFPKWGYIDKTGKMVITPQFLGMHQGSFSGGAAMVSMQFLFSPDSHAGPSYIDKTGKFIWKDRNTR
ncbi:WG repeat-containing protein [bacterium]|nr:WG repeat-containing protein [bacterium]